MTDLYKKMNELDNKYDPGYDFEEETVDYLKSKFPEIYKLIIEEIKKDPTVIDPVAEYTRKICRSYWR